MTDIGTTTTQSEFSDFMAAYQKRRDLKKVLASINAKSLFEAFVQTNITSVEVEFDGAGDSGQIEQITPYREAEICDWPTCEINIQDLDMNGGGVLISLDMQKAIEALCYDFLEDREGGWENNDGAYGTFSFDVAARTVTLDFNARYTAVENTAYHIEAGEI